jgi:hypothetical protein
MLNIEVAQRGGGIERREQTLKRRERAGDLRLKRNLIIRDRVL